MLEVRHPRTWVPERQYALGVLLGDWLGLEHGFFPDDRMDTRIEREGGGPSVDIEDGLFALPESARLTPGSVSRPPFPQWRVAEPQLEEALVSPLLPLIGARADSSPVTFSEDGAALNFDLVGAVFMMLSRYEEVASPAVAPIHGRYPREASMAWRGGFDRRPLADEYCRVLAWALARAGVLTKVPTPVGRYRVVVTHDVDRPVSALEGGAGSLLRRLAADAGVRRDARLAWDRLLSYRSARRGQPDKDPFFCFDFLMDTAEEGGEAATFNLIARARDEGGFTKPSALDASYRLTDGWMRSLIDRILTRGHSVGVHGSYNSYLSEEQLKAEMSQIRTVVEDLGHPAPQLPSRQHYLRLRTPETWRCLAAAGVSYDSTLGYAEGPGFRAGTCHPFRVFDVLSRTGLPLLERPLIVMDVALRSHGIRGAEPDTALAEVADLARACRKVEGEMVLLWHNNTAAGVSGRRLYDDLVREIVR